jgi:uncharacterized protein (TIGR02996 family)
MSTETHQKFELAIAHDPDNIPAISAFADFLMEQNDPRGEYIRLQLALEDRNQPISTLEAMRRDARDLWIRYEREWLGPLYPYAHPVTQGVIEPSEPNLDITYRYGAIHEVHIERASRELMKALVSCPIAAWTESINIQSCEIGSLLRLGQFISLRNLSIGGGIQETITGSLIRKMSRLPRLESIHLTANTLRVSAFWGTDWLRLRRLSLSISELSGIQRPEKIGSFLLLEAISLLGQCWPGSWQDFFAAKNFPLLRKLSLQIGPDFGDVGLNALLSSPVFSQLLELELLGCGITDEGAEALSRHPHTPRLSVLRLDHNHISPLGSAALEVVGIVVSEQQLLGPEPDVTMTEWDT